MSIKSEAPGQLTSYTYSIGIGRASAVVVHTIMCVRILTTFYHTLVLRD